MLCRLPLKDRCRLDVIRHKPYFFCKIRKKNLIVQIYLSLLDICSRCNVLQSYVAGRENGREPARGLQWFCGNTLNTWVPAVCSRFAVSSQSVPARRFCFSTLGPSALALPPLRGGPLPLQARVLTVPKQNLRLRNRQPPSPQEPGRWGSNSAKAGKRQCDYPLVPSNYLLIAATNRYYPKVAAKNLLIKLSVTLFFLSAF